VGTLFVIILVILFILFVGFQLNKPTIVNEQGNPITDKTEKKYISTLIGFPYRIYSTINKHFQKTDVFVRKTYIKGKLIAEFRGEEVSDKKLSSLDNQKYFNYDIIDAYVEADIRTNNEGDFINWHSSPLPYVNRSIKPDPLPIKLKIKGEDLIFEKELSSLTIWAVDFNKYRAFQHINDGKIFGKLEAEISGVIIEHESKVSFFEEVKPTFEEVVHTTEIIEAYEPTIQKTIIYKSKVAPAVNVKNSNSIWDIFWMIIGVLILGTIILSGGWVILLPIGIIYLFNWLLQKLPPFVSRGVNLFGSIIFFITGILFIGLLLFSIINYALHFQSIREKSFARDLPIEIEPIPPSIDTAINTVKDSLIYHFRAWKDYNNNKYSGTIFVKSSDVNASSYFKNTIQIPPYFTQQKMYDTLIYAIKNNDSALLGGVYQMFDTLKTNKQLDSLLFADCIVSFVQDIPYALVLESTCNANEYTDNFIRSYLQTANANCEPFQKYGINTPVEFMGNLKGDCDTRTLLLYTILKHYNYDILLLSSEILKHSIIAINLPYTGKYFKTQDGKKYYFWETTSLDMQAGQLSAEIADNYNWRITLQSKK
jgi:hypothetical protein